MWAVTCQRHAKSGQRGLSPAPLSSANLTSWQNQYGATASLVDQSENLSQTFLSSRDLVELALAEEWLFADELEQDSWAVVESVAKEVPQRVFGE